MKNIIYYMILIGLTGLFAQDLLKEMEVAIKVMDKGVSVQPNTAKLMVKSNIIDPGFESNRGITRVVDKGNGEYTITLSPGSQRIGIKADGYMAYSERHTFESQKVYECTIKDKTNYLMRDNEENLFETSFILNVPDVYCSFNDYAPNKSLGTRTIFKLPEGEYTFHFKKDGYKEFSRTIKVDGDTVTNIDLIKDSLQKLAYQSPGIAVINSVPEGAEIILDGQKYGNTNKTLTGITPGKHQLTVSINKYFSDLSTFEMSSGEIKNINLTLKPNFGYLNVISHPAEVEVFIDNKYIGFTPIENLELESGKYSLSAKKALYHTYTSQEILIDANEEHEIEFELKPAFGSMEINSVPIEDAEVLIDGVLIGMTPYKNDRYPSGEYTLEVKKENYSTVTERIIITDETAAKKTVVLSPNVGELVVNSEEADIYLNNVLMARTQFETMLKPGDYIVKLEKENHYPQEKKITIYAGKTESIDVTLLHKQGSVSIIVEPNNMQTTTEILINGESIGNPPQIKTLNIGTYLITAKVNRKVYNQSVDVSENQDSPVKFVVEGSKQAAVTQTNFEIPPKQQKAVIPKTVVKENRNFKPLYYIAGAAVIGGAYYYYKVNKAVQDPTTGSLTIEIDIP